MSVNKVTFTAVLWLLAFTVAAGDKIYRWVDDRGVTHFSHVKPTDSNITNVEELVLHNSNSYKPAKTIVKPQSPSTEFDKVAKRNCAIAQKNLKILSAFKNITQQDENGEVTKLSASDRQEQLTLASKQIELFCKEPVN